MRASDASIGKEDIEPSVPVQSILDNFADGFLIGGIQLPRVYIHPGIQRFNLPLMCFKIGIIVVADVDCLCPVLSKLVSGCSANTKDRVCAFGPVC